MVVRSKTSFITEQMTGQLSTMESEKGILKEKVQELEAKYKKLLELSEKVQADLNKKSEACKCLEEELQKFKEDNEKLVQLKSTLGAARRYDEKGGSGSRNLDLEIGTTAIADQEFAKKNSFSTDKISLHVPDFQLDNSSCIQKGCSK